MNPKIAALAAKIQILEAELEAELAQRRAELSVGLERGRVFFEEEILRRHRELRTRLLSGAIDTTGEVMTSLDFHGDAPFSLRSP